MDVDVQSPLDALAAQGWLVVLVATAGLACGQGRTPTAPSPGVPPTAVDLRSALSASFDTLVLPGNAACSLSISQHGQVVLEQARGQVASARLAAPDSLYRIASLTKPITASAVLISERAGKLDRGDAVDRFVAFAEPSPTIDELIRHVPGLSYDMNAPPNLSDKTSPITLDGLLSLIQPWDGVRRHQYSNAHYALLGAVLQQTNGLPYEAVVARDIFAPVGMSRSSFQLPPPSDSWPFPSPTHPTRAYAAGGVTSTAADMNRFNQALLSNFFGFGAVESFDRNATDVTSFGMTSAAGNGDLRFAHGGILDNYSSFSAIFPADRSSIVVLCNYNYGPGVLFNLVMGLRAILLTGK